MGSNAAARATLRRWKADPAAMVREEFGVVPDAWQAEVLALFPRHNRLAMKACKGPGKTALLAWLILNFLATRPHARVGATSITGDNLAQNLWPELAKWMQKSAWFQHAFQWTATKVVSREFPSTWWAMARTWPKKADAQQQADAMAGLHEDYAMWVLDESGGIPQAVMTTCEAVLASGLETKVVQAGNPTHTDGPLYRAVNQDRHLWRTVTVTGDPDSPRRSPRIDIHWARQQIASYGRDNPWVMVNVLGEFPPASINALLGLEEVEQAMGRHLRDDQFSHAQKRLGVDAARFGDDPWVIFPRQGLAAFQPVTMRNPLTTAVAARVAKAIVDWGAELTFVDDTGHWGHGVTDTLLTAGYPIIPVIYSDKALSPRYRNRRVEMWIAMAKWVRAGGALPPLPELVAELTVPTYTFIGGVFVLEEKDQIKERLGRSPNHADALAQTFCLPDMPASADIVAKMLRPSHAQVEFDPYQVALEAGRGKLLTEFDPYRD